MSCSQCIVPVPRTSVACMCCLVRHGVSRVLEPGLQKINSGCFQLSKRLCCCRGRIHLPPTCFYPRCLQRSLGLRSVPKSLINDKIGPGFIFYFILIFKKFTAGHGGPCLHSQYSGDTDRLCLVMPKKLLFGGWGCVVLDRFFGVFVCVRFAVLELAL